MQAQRTVTLADALFPRIQTNNRVWIIAREVALMVGFAVFTAVCAQMAARIPWTTVPITGQTFAVLVTGGALGAWRGAGSMSIYVLLAIVGVPVFAPNLAATGETAHLVFPWHGTSGVPWNMSSGGYIVGFVFAAALIGFLAERGWDRKPWLPAGLLAANAVIYLFGLPWFGYLIGSGWVHPALGRPLADVIAGSGTLEKTLVGGLYPLIPGDLIKLYAAALSLPAAWAVVQRVRR